MGVRPQIEELATDEYANVIIAMVKMGHLGGACGPTLRVRGTSILDGRDIRALQDRTLAIFNCGKRTQLLRGLL
jgi:hypothetical protein